MKVTEIKHKVVDEKPIVNIELTKSEVEILQAVISPLSSTSDVKHNGIDPAQFLDELYVKIEKTAGVDGGRPDFDFDGNFS